MVYIYIDVDVHVDVYVCSEQLAGWTVSRKQSIVCRYISIRKHMQKQNSYANTYIYIYIYIPIYIAWVQRQNAVCITGTLRKLRGVHISETITR